ncbi:MAG: helix-turn-helix domain-containing protein [Candidatus Microthrix subdominans]
MTTIEPSSTKPYPTYLTVPQVQELTQLSRGQVYRMIERYIETGGTEGIPSVRFGRCLRVPSHMLPTGSDPAILEVADQ